MHIPGSYEEEDTCMHAMTQAAASIVAYDQHQRPAHAQVSWTEETSVMAITITLADPPGNMRRRIHACTHDPGCRIHRSLRSRVEED
jgi:hypothetical protein